MAKKYTEDVVEEDPINKNEETSETLDLTTIFKLKDPMQFKEFLISNDYAFIESHDCIASRITFEIKSDCAGEYFVVLFKFGGNFDKCYYTHTNPNLYNNSALMLHSAISTGQYSSIFVHDGLNMIRRNRSSKRKDEKNDVHEQ